MTGVFIRTTGDIQRHAKKGWITTKAESTPGTAAKGCPGYAGGSKSSRRLLLQTFLPRELGELLWFSATCFVVFLLEFPEHHCPHLLYCSLPIQLSCRPFPIPSRSTQLSSPSTDKLLYIMSQKFRFPGFYMSTPLSDNYQEISQGPNAGK